VAAVDIINQKKKKKVTKRHDFERFEPLSGDFGVKNFGHFLAQISGCQATPENPANRRSTTKKRSRRGMILSDLNL